MAKEPSLFAGVNDVHCLKRCHEREKQDKKDCEGFCFHNLSAIRPGDKIHLRRLLAAFFFCLSNRVPLVSSGDDVIIELNAIRLEERVDFVVSCFHFI